MDASDTPHSRLPFVVPLEGGSNFRDLGGYATSDGRRVRRGTVFRSAHLGGLTEADRGRLAELGVRTIVDLRGVGEAAETPHAVAGVGARIIGAHIEPGVGDKLRRAIADGTITPFVAMDFLTDHYRDYPRRCAPGFRTLFTTLGDVAHRPLVFHCTAGKDRTGFASALLLTLLGVPWDTVIDDYLHTNEVWTGHVGRYPELDIDTRAAIIEARTPYLEAAFEVVRADFGSPEGFATKALGLDKDSLERLKFELLEAA
jgi:protein-tyrosine phosphatase